VARTTEEKVRELITGIKNDPASQRLLTGLAFFFLTVGVISAWTRPAIVGPWDQIYRNYAAFWMLSFTGTVCLLVAIRSGRVQWSVVAIFGLALTLGVTSLSLMWGYPYGLHDPWVHLEVLKNRRLSPSSNPYPLFHALLLWLGELSGVTAQSLLRYAPIISILLGYGFSVILARRLSGDPVARQTALIVSVPALFLGFIARPFTLGMPFVLLAYWVCFALGSSSRTRWAAGLLIVPTVWLHPFAGVGSAIILGSYLLVVVVKEGRGLHHANKTILIGNNTIRVYGPLVVTFGAVLTVNFIIVSNISNNIFTSIIDSFTSFVEIPSDPSGRRPAVAEEPTPPTTGNRDQSTATAVPDQSVDDGGESTATAVPDQGANNRESETDQGGNTAGIGLVAEMFSSPSKLTEALSRASFMLSIAFAALLSLRTEFSRREITKKTAVTFIAGVGTLTIFILLVSFASRGFGLFRILMIAPLVGLPAVVAALERRDTTRRELFSLLLAALILLTGLLTAFPSTFTGGAAYTATEPQVAGVEWVGEYRSNTITGTWMTFWIIEGIFGKPESRIWSPGDTYGKRVWNLRGASYSWNVSERNESSLYVVDRVELERAKLEARESGSDAPVWCYREFAVRSQKVYDNGGTEVFTHVVTCDSK
jgi:hypothetical protein